MSFFTHKEEIPFAIANDLLTCQRCGCRAMDHVHLTGECPSPDIKDTRECTVSVKMVDSALDQQVGGDHYKDLKIQPIEYIHANGIGYFEGNVIKYVTRWREKGGIADLKKARHYLDLQIELEERKDETANCI